MRTLILSDLHISNDGPQGLYAGGDALPKLLAREAQGAVRIILNGDAFDFLPGDDPLELNVDRAVAKAGQIVKVPVAAATLRALGRVLAAGGEVIIRVGNHDVEMALPEVQAVFRAALEQPAAVAGRLQFSLGDKPAFLEVGGVRILYTHGEHDDDFNRVEYDYLPGPTGEAPRKRGKFTYPPGSLLVRKLLNPLRDVYKMRFADFLKPDFQGAVLAALAVDAAACRLLFQKASYSILWQVMRNAGTAISFAPGADGETEPDLALADRVDGADLNEGEKMQLEALLRGDDMAVNFAGGQGDGLSVKLAKTGLKLYARAHRMLGGKQGDAFFSLEPDEGEVKPMRKLAAKHGVRAVITGHTHAARWFQDDTLLYVNTGTWISLMRLPGETAGEAEWHDWLDELRSNPELEPTRQQRVKTESRLTVCVVEEQRGGGANVSLQESDAAGALRAIQSQVIRPA